MVRVHLQFHLSLPATVHSYGVGGNIQCCFTSFQLLEDLGTVLVPSYIGGSIVMGILQNGWFIMENTTIKIDDLGIGVPPFQETSIFNIFIRPGMIHEFVKTMMGHPYMAILNGTMWKHDDRP